MCKSASDIKSKKGVHGVEKEKPTRNDEGEEEPTRDDDFMVVGFLENIRSFGNSDKWVVLDIVRNKLMQFQLDQGLQITASGPYLGRSSDFGPARPWL